MDPQQRIERWVNLVERNAPAEQIQQAEKDVAEALKQQPYEVRQQSPSSRSSSRNSTPPWPSSSFGPPGRDRVIEDRREHPQGEPAKGAASEAARRATKQDVAKGMAEGPRQLQMKATANSSSIANAPMRITSGPARR